MCNTHAHTYTKHMHAHTKHMYVHTYNLFDTLIIAKEVT